MTIGAALQAATAQLRAAGIDDGEAEGMEHSRLEAEILLAHALGVDRAHLLARLSDDIPADRAPLIESMIARRARREPLSYITGACEFYGLNMACAPGSLIPRPETEMLVDAALEFIGASSHRADSLRIVDVGTGSGAIAIAIAVNAPHVRVTAVDASQRALAVARRNIEALGVADRVELHVGDTLDALGEFDLIVANLPYITESEYPALPPEIRDWEPREALVGGPAGTELNTRLLEAARSQLAHGGLLAAEIGADHGDAISQVARACFPGADVCVKKDYAGLDRMLVVRNGETSD